jgi:predicted RNA methylase
MEAYYGAKEAYQDSRLGIPTYVRPSTALNFPAGSRHAYEALNYVCIRLIRDRLSLGAEDVLCDAGSGRGRILCVFARHPIKACIGLEYDPVLADAARDNIARLLGRRSPVTVVTGDAADYDYSQVTALVMYNPFGADTLRSVLKGLSSSLVANPRHIQIVYANPIHEAEFDEFPAFIERERCLAPYVADRMSIIFWSGLP